MLTVNRDSTTSANGAVEWCKVPEPEHHQKLHRIALAPSLIWVSRFCCSQQTMHDTGMDGPGLVGHYKWANLDACIEYFEQRLGVQLLNQWGKWVTQGFQGPVTSQTIGDIGMTEHPSEPWHPSPQFLIKIIYCRFCRSDVPVTHGLLLKICCFVQQLGAHQLGHQSCHRSHKGVHDRKAQRIASVVAQDVAEGRKCCHGLKKLHRHLIAAASLAVHIHQQYADLICYIHSQLHGVWLGHEKKGDNVRPSNWHNGCSYTYPNLHMRFMPLHKRYLTMLRQVQLTVVHNHAGNEKQCAPVRELLMDEYSMRYLLNFDTYWGKPANRHSPS